MYDEKLLIIGHRGAAGLAPENTLEAFERAFQAGVKWVETDVYLSGDNKCVLTHDRFVGGYDIKKSTFKTFKSKANNKCITLDNLLENFAGKLFFNIEIKASEAFPKVIQIVRERNLSADVLISSFDHLAIRNYLKNNHDIDFAPIVASRPVSMKVFCKGIGNIPVVVANAQMVDTLMIQELAEMQVRLYLYNVDAVSFDRDLHLHGVSALIVDRPDQFIKLIST